MLSHVSCTSSATVSSGFKMHGNWFKLKCLQLRHVCVDQGQYTVFGVAFGVAVLMFVELEVGILPDQPSCCWHEAPIGCPGECPFVEGLPFC